VHIRKTLIIGNTALALVLGYIVTKALMAPNSITQNLSPRSAHAFQNKVSQPSSSQLSQPDYTDLLESNMFGNNQSQSNSAFSAPAAKLNLELIGTVAGPAQLARAIIKDLSNNNIALYKITDHIAGARIAEIDRNQVLLIHNGQTSILKLSSTQAKQQPVNKTFAPAATSNKPQSKTNTLEKILQTATLQPHITDGQTDGLQLDGLENLAMTKYIGLKNGDVIHSINGQTLTSKQKAFQVFKKARTQARIDIELLRNKKIETLSFDLN